VTASWGRRAWGWWESNSKPRDDAKRESDGFRKLRHAVEKGPGDRDRAIRNVCRLYGVKTVEALPGAIRVATLAAPRLRVSTR
jgi:hypothetical protein